MRSKYVSNNVWRDSKTSSVSICNGSTEEFQRQFKLLLDFPIGHFILPLQPLTDADIPSKWRPNYRFSFRVISISAHNRSFWLIIGVCEYIYNTEMKMENVYSCAIFRCKTIFWAPHPQKC